MGKCLCVCGGGGGGGNVEQKDKLKNVMCLLSIELRNFGIKSLAINH